LFLEVAKDERDSNDKQTKRLIELNYKPKILTLKSGKNVKKSTKCLRKANEVKGWETTGFLQK
jgi:hypothetical protein